MRDETDRAANSEPTAAATAASLQQDLIFDIGVNHGEDSEFYLSKGFRVVGVEADPIIAAELQQSFRQAISSGRYVLENIGMSYEAATLPFYRNLECDHWSSFEHSYGTRDGTRHEIIQIPCVEITDLIAQHGCPYYMKIDIEGADRHVLDVLQKTAIRPRFISIEEFGSQSIDLLFDMGYNMFSLRTQNDKSWATPPNPPREGKYVDRAFTQRDSGLFGFEVPQWMPFDMVKQEYGRKVRSDTGAWLPPPGEWYDIHATYWPSVINDRQLDLKLK